MSWQATARFYEQLRMLLHSGIGMQQAMGMLRDRVPRPYADWLPALSLAIDRGQPLSGQLQRFGERPLPIALIAAGERSGHLPEVCARIVDIYEQAIQVRRQCIVRSIYPVLLLHVAMIMPAVVMFFVKNSSPWWIAAGPGLFWGGLAALWAMHRIGLASGLSARIGTWPIIGGVVGAAVTANVALVLQASVSAGLGFAECLEMAATAAGNRVWRDRLKQAAYDLRHDRLDSFTAAVRQAGFPPDLTDLCSSGEVSGELDVALDRIARLQRERFSHRLQWAVRIFTGAIMAVAMLIAVIAIFSIAMTYLGMVNQVMSEI